jgi:signal transduction histidine kinase
MPTLEQTSEQWPLNAGSRSARIIPWAIAGALAVATAIDCHAQATGATSLLAWTLSLAYGAVLWLWWALVIDLFWQSSSRWPAALKISLPAAGAQMLIGIGLVFVHLAILQSAVHLIIKFGPPATVSDYWTLDFFCLPRIGMEFLVFALSWLACAAIKSQLSAQRDAIHSLELQKQLSRAQLQALQMQLQPHFLFNTLNAVTTLIELERPDEALETLDHLNALLKSVLKKDAPTKISLAQELEIVESYLAIERVRFADRLRVDINLDPNALDGLVPRFLLQPIVENAIRHGIARCENSGLIETSAKRIGSRLQLQVRDNGPGLNPNSRAGFGVGLSNTRERLVHFYQDDYELRAFQPESGGFEVSITIPYERTTS